MLTRGTATELVVPYEKTGVDNTTGRDEYSTYSVPVSSLSDRELRDLMGQISYIAESVGNNPTLGTSPRVSWVLGVLFGREGETHIYSWNGEGIRGAQSPAGFTGFEGFIGSGTVGIGINFNGLAIDSGNNYDRYFDLLLNVLCHESLHAYNFHHYANGDHNNIWFHEHSESDAIYSETRRIVKLIHKGHPDELRHFVPSFPVFPIIKP